MSSTTHQDAERQSISNGENMSIPNISESSVMSLTPPPYGGSNMSSTNVSGYSSPLQSQYSCESENRGDDTRWILFQEIFNSEFASFLHAFSTMENAHNQTQGRVNTASAEEVDICTLSNLFTVNQREKIIAFHNTRVIPDRLFNSDEQGNLSAQQRILLSSHILAVGTYRPGSFSQRLHARMCGHWVNLVYSYAGAGHGGRRGIREQFDHQGNLSLATGRRESWSGARIANDEYVAGEVRPERSRFQMRGLSWDALNTLKPGDWLWYFNDNGGAGGNHSVIFSRWASDEQQILDSSGRPNRYRRAICVSQGNPRNGGREHTVLLGERYSRRIFHLNENGREVTDRGSICPVTHFSRVSADTGIIQSADDLRRVLGVGGNARHNRNFISRMLRRNRGMRFNYALFADYLRSQNEELIQTLLDSIGKRITRGQINAIRELNTSNGNETEDITTLIVLNSRIQSWISNASTLEANQQIHTERIEARRAENLERTRDQRAAYNSELDALRPEQQSLEDQQVLLNEQIESLSQSGRIAELSRTRRSLVRQRNAIRTQIQNTRRSEQGPLIEERRSIQDQINEISGEINTLSAVRRSNNSEIRQLRATRNGNRRPLNRLNMRIRVLEGRLARLESANGYVTAHHGRGNAFNGRGENRNGQMRNLNPTPDWSLFLERE